MSAISNPISRRNMLTAAAGASALSATTLAQAQTADSMPETRRPGRGGSNPGPKNPVRASQNPDLLSPPASDHGTLPNLRFSFDDSHVRLESGGWTRQVTVRELGISKNIAGVNMRLNAGGVRELHWHKAAEWSYMLYGTARITGVDANGRACGATSRHSASAAASSGCNGIERPLHFFAEWSGSSIRPPIRPTASVTMVHVKFAISPARRPALADNRTSTRFLSGFRVQLANTSKSWRLSGERIFAWRPAILS